MDFFTKNKLSSKMLFSVLCFLSLICSTSMYSSEILSTHFESECNNSEYFSVDLIKCVYCDSSKSVVPSENKQSCVCNNLSYQARWSKEENPICINCKPGEVATKDGKYCVACSNTTDKTVTQLVKCKKCASNEVTVERSIDGSLLPSKECIQCAPGTRPSHNRTRCIPCLIPNISGHNDSCSCPQNSHELLGPDICATHSELAAWSDDSTTFNLEYTLSNKVIQSMLLKENLRRDVYLCKSQRRNSACQSVANMCVLTHFKDGPACSLFRDFKHIPSSEREPYPWLYYGDGDAPTVLNRRKITHRYSLDPTSELRWLNLTANKWSINGTWLGMSTMRGAGLQLCAGDWTSQNAALRFGTHYSQECKIRASQLLSSHRQTEFYSLYLQFDSFLYALPVLDTSFQHGNRFPNRESDIGQWQLTRRFFLMDTVSGLSVNGNKVEIIQYLKSATLRVRAQQGDDQGKIYPPLLILKYGEMTAKDVESDSYLHISFFVDFYMDSHVTYTVDIWLGVLCGLAVVWSALQTWSFSKRSAHLTIDLLTLCHLCLIACGHLSNVFFSVVALTALYIFVFYKGQSVAHVLLPSRSFDSYVHTYVIVAFTLKMVEVINMVWRQMTVDIFLIDWERPRATKNNNQPVSIWRTYFVANEWNEIQSHRKTSLTIQLICTVLLIKVFGLENWAISDPDLNIVITPEMLFRPSNFTLQFAVAFLVYIFVYVVQWCLLSGVYKRYIKDNVQEFVDVCSLANISVFILTLENFGYYVHGRLILCLTFQWCLLSGVYERYIKDNIQEFVDVCSLANISVFILTLENFGYYVHGRSAHGFADTDMQTIMNQLRREEEDLVGHRGLLPASDHQTFQIYIPSQLRSYYHRVMPPALMTKQLPSAVTMALRLKLTGSTSSADFDRSVVAYHNMNKFLAAFLEHALRDLDYEVRDKQFAEALLDIEFSDVPGKAVFYVDNGHSFDNVLFYGNELTLFSMDLMVFCFFQVVTGDFLLAAIITALIAKVH